MPLDDALSVKCPVCGEGMVVEKRSRKGKVFYGCNRYPDCSFVTWDKPTEKPCPQCGGLLGERRFRGRLVGYRCTNPNCSYETRASEETEEAPAEPDEVAAAQAAV